MPCSFAGIIGKQVRILRDPVTVIERVSPLCHWEFNDPGKADLHAMFLSQETCRCFVQETLCDPQAVQGAAESFRITRNWSYSLKEQCSLFSVTFLP